MEDDSRTPRPIARVYFDGENSSSAGWYLQRYVGLELLTIRLRLDAASDAFDVVAKAADLLACASDRVQVEGPRWPSRLAETA